ncbi:hypothetical protein tb265_09920 [Gemmatimonadetes bacterium T265]|nr:hypothetical protein tb265_09920 [Gemmatimonadetes bacterium T265]
MATILQPAAVPKRMTAEEFLNYPWGDTPVELVHGEVRVAPFPAGAHAHVVDNMYGALRDYVRAHQLGRVYGDNTGYALPHRDDTIRGPDVSFVRAGRLPDELPLKGLFQIAPDFGVEVLSPSDTYAEVAEKLDDFFSAGVELMWLLDPRRRRVEAVAPDGARRTFAERGAAEVADAAPVLPGFTMAVADVFAGVAREA